MERLNEAGRRGEGRWEVRELASGHRKRKHFALPALWCLSHVNASPIIKKNEKDMPVVDIAVLHLPRGICLWMWSAGRNTGPGNRASGLPHSIINVSSLGLCISFCRKEVLRGDGHGGIKLYQCFLIHLRIWVIWEALKYIASQALISTLLWFNRTGVKVGGLHFSKAFTLGNSDIGSGLETLDHMMSPSKS